MKDDKNLRQPIIIGDLIWVGLMGVVYGAAVVSFILWAF